jgi:hypothetical protein
MTTRSWLRTAFDPKLLRITARPGPQARVTLEILADRLAPARTDEPTLALDSVCPAPAPSEHSPVEEQCGWHCEPATEDDRPWEQPGAVRRDIEPHRGDLLRVLGDGGLLLGALSLCLGFLAPLGLGLGLAAWVLSSYDLRRMRARLLDPDGLAATAYGRRRARAGVALSLYGAIMWGWFLAVITRAVG